MTWRHLTLSIQFLFSTDTVNTFVVFFLLLFKIHRILISNLIIVYLPGKQGIIG